MAFSAPYPGKIIPVDMNALGNELICQKDAFLCAALGTRVSIAFNRKLGAGFFGGEGFILQRLQGDGMAFVHAGGTIVQKKLNHETIRVDTGCIVGFTPGIDYDIERAGNLKSMAKQINKKPPTRKAELKTGLEKKINPPKPEKHHYGDLADTPDLTVRKTAHAALLNLNILLTMVAEKKIEVSLPAGWKTTPCDSSGKRKALLQGSFNRLIP